jgi:Uncharacterized protein, possibly involved in utilization of glycolate and propanediol
MNKTLACLLFAVAPGLAHAAEIAMKSVEACRKDGYNVSAVVLDRGGSVQAALRDEPGCPLHA